MLANAANPGTQIDNVIVEGSVVASESYYVGGLVGSLLDSSYINNVISLVNITANGVGKVGGIVGFQDSASITNSVFGGSIISNDSDNVGGISGMTQNAVGNIVLDSNTVNGKITVTNSENFGSVVGYIYDCGSSDGASISNNKIDTTYADVSVIGEAILDNPDYVIQSTITATNTIYEDLPSQIPGLVVYDSSGTSVGTLNLTTTSSLQDIFDQLSNYGINASLENGVITLDSTNGNYVAGAVAEALGIEVVSTGSGSSTIGIGVSSSVQVTFTTEGTISYDTKLSELVLNQGLLNFVERKTEQEAIDDGYIWVTTAEQLNQVMHNDSFMMNNINAKIMLGADIDLSGIDWEAVGLLDEGIEACFRGVFDGNGYTISNLTARGGFFAALDDATIKNIRFENVNITDGLETTTLIGSSQIAGVLAVEASGANISNVALDGSINISGNKDIIAGGLVGFSHDSGSCTIESILSEVDISVNTTGSDLISIAGGIIGASENEALILSNLIYNGDLVSNYYTGGIYGRLYHGSGSADNLQVYGNLSGNKVGIYAGYNYSSASVNNIKYSSSLSSLGFEGFRDSEIPFVPANPTIVDTVPDDFTALTFEILSRDGVNQGTLNINENSTLGDLVNELGKYGIEASLSVDGVLSLDSENGNVLGGSGAEALGISMVYGEITETTPSNVTSSAPITYNTITTGIATGSTTLSQLGLTLDGTITVNQNGTEQTITVNGSTTVDEMLSSLSNLGINGGVTSGKLNLFASPDSILMGMSQNLEDIFKIETGEGHSYTISSENGYSNTDSRPLGDASVTETMKTSTTLSDLGLTGSATISGVYNGTNFTVTVTEDQTVGDLIISLAGYGITGSVNNGILTLNPVGNGYLTSIDSTLQDALKLSDFGEGNSYETTTGGGHTNTSSDRLEITGSDVAITGSTKLGDITGFTQDGTILIHQANGSYATITVSASQTLNDFFNQISGYGLVGNIDSEGNVTITGMGNVYLESGSSDLLDALHLSDVKTNSRTIFSNSTSDELRESGEGKANNTTRLEDLKDVDGNTLTFDASGETSLILETPEETVTLTFNKTQSLGDVITELADYGITARVDSQGNFLVQTDHTDFDISGDLGTFLMGDSYTKEYQTTVSNNRSTILTQTTVTSMTDDTLLSEFNITGGDIILMKNGEESSRITIDLNTLQTVGDFRNLLSRYGFTTNIDSQGRLSISNNSGDYLESGSSDILSVFGLEDFSILGVNQQSSSLTETTIDNKVISMSSKLQDLTDVNGNELNITSGNIYVYKDGVRNTLYIDNQSTLQSLADKLAQYGINMGIANGKITLEGNGNSYLTSDGLTGASNLLEKIGITDWETNSTTSSGQITFEQEENTVVDNNTKLLDLKDKLGNSLGITEGTFNVYQNGIKYTETIDSDTTVGDLITTLESYGFNVTTSSNGAISVSANGNAYIEDNSSNIASKLFGTWKFNNSYTSGILNTTTPVTQTITENTKLGNINVQDGYITVLNGGVKTNVSISSNATIGDFIDQLKLYGFDAVLNDQGQLIVKASGNSTLQDYSGPDPASNILQILGLENADWINSKIYQSGNVDVIEKTTMTTAATEDTKLSDLGVTAGEYYIYNNGVKYTALISSNDTLGDFMETLEKFGLQTSISGDGANSILTILGQGDSYISKSNNVNNASNVVEKLFGDVDTKYQYSSDKETSEVVTSIVSATEDTLLSEFDTPWGGTTLKAEGDLSVTYNDVTSTIKITADETFGSLIKKLNAIGIEATLTDGRLMIQSGYDTFTINTDKTTSSIINPNTKIGLTFQDDLGGYVASSETVMATTTTVEERTISVANYADENTKLGLLNISDGTLSVYRNGQKATIQINSEDTFGDLRAKLSSAFSDVELKFEDGYLSIYSKDGNQIDVGATTDTSNFSAITGISKDENGNMRSARALYRVNNDSVVTGADLFRRGNVTEGTFYVGNAMFSIDNTTTLSDIISQINSSEDANATAYWDNIDGKLVIQSRTTGSAYINIEAGTSNFTDIMGFTTSEWTADGKLSVTRMNTNTQDVGDNAKFSINGTNYTSTSNTVTSDVSRIKGLTINLKGLTEGSAVTLTIEKDTETVANALSDVVDAYNELMKNVDEAIASNGDLHSETTLKMIRNQLRNMMTSSDAGTTVFRNLDAIGISVDAASANNISTDNIINLTFDKDKFLEAYESDSKAVKELLVGSENNTGVFNKVETLIESALESVSGYFDSASNSFDREIDRIDKKIVNATEDMQRYRERLESKFSAMDMLIANMQQQYASFLGV